MTEDGGQAREDLPELDLRAGKELVLVTSRSLVVGGVEKASVASITANSLHRACHAAGA